MRATIRSNGCTMHRAFSAAKGIVFIGSSVSLLFPRSSPAGRSHLHLLSRAQHRPISTSNRSCLAMSVRSGAALAIHDPLPTGSEAFFRTVISNMEKVYLNRNPTAKAILDLVQSHDGDHICYDHFAFRTFGVDGYGINSLAEFFMDFGYTPREELRFPAKKLRALWFSPPSKISFNNNGTGVNGPLPRIFISEIIVDQLSSESQEVIRKYVKTSGSGYKYASLASMFGGLTWEKPSFSDYQVLSRESEYAAWTLVNGYALNHVTISTHRLKSDIRRIQTLNKFIEDSGFKLNSEGGILKVSPDGLLQQSSTVADSISFTFADGKTDRVPCSYIEFAERLPLPLFKNLPDEELKESHRREGFEVGNADKIFESTSKDQLTRKVA
ncbi:hypothetical protein FCM35_KLT08548 [Carex littledalei]|uniref:2-oxoadipate dioxygenase/decarboxylase n=1 Tax=Carex littledalei TaxID=544730 RepID=A0A833QXU1_9POAL|nr:hypothetical protein FCM35_KLT08548 [Carex littledalei]